MIRRTLLMLACVASLAVAPPARASEDAATPSVHADEPSDLGLRDLFTSG
jgi:hypothetical protein